VKAGDVTLPDEILRGIRHFNAGEYFEAHEAWEDHWGHGGPQERAATLGLIKAAVALHHLQAGNGPGFAWQAQEAIRNLRGNHEVWPALRLDALAEALDGLAAEVRFHGRAQGGLPRIPEKGE